MPGADPTTGCDGRSQPSNVEPAAPRAVAPLQWPWALASPPAASSESTPWRGALLRRWCGTSPVMVQPPLDQHYIVMHLGGAKRVTRRRDGPQLAATVEGGSITIVPAGTAYTWRTEGPIAFAHLYLPPRRLAETIERELDRAGRDALLVDRVGCRDPLLEPVMATMLDEIEAGAEASTIRLDSLFETFCSRLARQHCAQSPARDPRPVALAPHRLRRVLARIESDLASDLSLADLAAAAGSSQSHFCRAFRLATGASPYRYLIDRRIERAKVLLLTGSEPLEAIARAGGFQHLQQFTRMFKQSVGVGPKRFRVLHRRKGR